MKNLKRTTAVVCSMLLLVACGKGIRKDNGELVPLSVSTGDTILFGKWSGTEVTIDGEDLLIVKESDILGILH